MGRRSRGSAGRAAALLMLPLALGAALASSVLAAPGDATATRVADINTTGDAGPTNLFDAGGTLLFAADDGVNGGELWKSDGTEAGTVQVAEIASGAEGSNPNGFARIGDKVFFAASEAVGPSFSGRELWVTEPPYTTATMAADVNDGTGSSDPENLTAAGTTLFFSASNGINGRELWKSVPPYGDAQTTMVKDINTTPDAAAESFPIELTPVSDSLVLFAADDGTVGNELWKSDGNEGGTVLVDDLNDAADSSDLEELTNVNGNVFFAATDGAGDSELWKSAGPGYDDASTDIVENINPTADANPARLENVNGTLLFRALDGIAVGFNGEELWKSAPPYSAASTELVEDINPGTSSSNPSVITDVNGTAYFSASGGNPENDELWRSAPPFTAATTSLAANVNPTPNAGSGISEIAAFDGQAFLLASQVGINNRELFKSTGSGATLVEDINGNPSTTSFTGGGTGELTAVGGALFFGANDGSTGEELWKATVEGPGVPKAPIPLGTVAIGKLKKRKLTVTVNLPGTVSVSAKGLLKTSSAQGGPGAVTVKLKLTKKAKGKLKKNGKLKVKVRAAFTPAAGTPASAAKKLKVK